MIFSDRAIRRDTSKEMNNRFQIYTTLCLVLILAITACTEQPELEYSKAEYASYTDFLNDTEFPYTRKTAASAESITGHLHKVSIGMPEEEVIRILGPPTYTNVFISKLTEKPSSFIHYFVYERNSREDHMTEKKIEIYFNYKSISTAVLHSNLDLGEIE